MLYLTYDTPIDRGKLPALNASFDRLKARIHRRKLLSGVCGALCLLLYAALMILGTVGIYRRVAGEEYAAVGYSLITVLPAGETWEIKPLLSCAALCIVVFAGSLVQATLTDIPLELLCGLDAQWDGTSLIEDLEAFIAKETGREESAAEAELPGEEREP